MMSKKKKIVFWLKFCPRGLPTKKVRSADVNLIG